MVEATSSDIKDKIGPALGKVASGVYIVTASSGLEKAGMLASWIMQASFEPPMLTVCLHPDREVYKLIQSSGSFTVNVVSKDNGNLMKAFGKYQPDQFEQVESKQTEYGLQLTDAIASLDCQVINAMDGGDHKVILAEIKNGEMLNESLESMIHIRKSGFHY